MCALIPYMCSIIWPPMPYMYVHSAYICVPFSYAPIPYMCAPILNICVHISYMCQNALYVHLQHVLTSAACLISYDVFCVSSSSLLILTTHHVSVSSPRVSVSPEVFHASFSGVCVYPCCSVWDQAPLFTNHSGCLRLRTGGLRSHLDVADHGLFWLLSKTCLDFYPC